MTVPEGEIYLYDWVAEEAIPQFPVGDVHSLQGPELAAKTPAERVDQAIQALGDFWRDNYGDLRQTLQEGGSVLERAEEHATVIQGRVVRPATRAIDAIRGFYGGSNFGDTGTAEDNLTNALTAYAQSQHMHALKGMFGGLKSFAEIAAGLHKRTAELRDATAAKVAADAAVSQPDASEEVPAPEADQPSAEQSELDAQPAPQSVRVVERTQQLNDLVESQLPVITWLGEQAANVLQDFANPNDLRKSATAHKVQALPAETVLLQLEFVQKWLVHTGGQAQNSVQLAAHFQQALPILEGWMNALEAKMPSRKAKPPQEEATIQQQVTDEKHDKSSVVVSANRHAI